MFKLPFPTWAAKTRIQIESEIRGEDGVTKTLLFSGLAIVDERAQRIKTGERSQVKMSSRVIIQGDILPGEDIKGFVTYNGQERTITSVQRIFVDGEVYSTEIGFE